MDALDGANKTNLTKGSALLNEDPAFSPNGKKIVFASYRNAGLDIYKMNLDGSNQQRLTKSPADDGEPSFSPDGKKIAFTSKRNGNNEIYTMNAKDGSKQQNRTNDLESDFTPDWGVVSS
jgi:Tol biopolymer transport system component